MISRRSRGHAFGGSYPTDLPITQENFPALLQGYTLASLQSDGLHDLLGNNVITSPDGWLLYNSSVQFVSTGDPTAVGFARQTGGNIGFTGTLKGFGAKNGVVFFVGSDIGSLSPNSARFGVNATGPSFGVSLPPTTNSCRLDASNACTPGPAILVGPIDGLVTIMDKTIGNGACFQDGWSMESGLIQGSGNGTLVGNITGNWPDFTSAGSFPGDDVVTGPSGGYCTGIFAFAFNNKPDRALLDDAMLWMKDNPGKIYPGLARRQ